MKQQLLDWLESFGLNDSQYVCVLVVIGLTTVKVRNRDKTITSIPSYALTSDSFKNWRNIEAVGGHDVQRAAECFGAP